MLDGRFAGGCRGGRVGRIGYRGGEEGFWLISGAMDAASPATALAGDTYSRATDDPCREVCFCLGVSYGLCLAVLLRLMFVSVEPA